MKKDYQTHVFTSTYTADVSGVCSAMYELGGMSVLHDPSGCNSTYSTHDEPRWFDSDSLMFVSGLDEITAVMGDDSVIIRDVKQAVEDLHPRFVTLCGASIPHIIAFDYRGVAHLMEEECGIPVLPVATDGLRSYISGADLAFSEWIRRFADPAEHALAQDNTVNLLGVTPLDFSINGNVEELRKTLEANGFTLNCCMAMGDSFDNLTHIYRAKCNLAVSSAGRKTAKMMKRMSAIPCVEGLPIGKDQTENTVRALRMSMEDGLDRKIWQTGETLIPSGTGCILVIGEEIFAKSLAGAINQLPDEQRSGCTAKPMWPDVDEGIAEEDLLKAVDSSDSVVADPLYKTAVRNKSVRFIPFPHEAYSGRIFRKDIPVFAGESFDTAAFIGNYI